MRGERLPGIEPGEGHQTPRPLRCPYVKGEKYSICESRPRVGAALPGARFPSSANLRRPGATLTRFSRRTVRSRGQLPAAMLPSLRVTHTDLARTIANPFGRCFPDC